MYMKHILFNNIYKCIYLNYFKKSFFLKSVYLNFLLFVTNLLHFFAAFKLTDITQRCIKQKLRLS